MLMYMSHKSCSFLFSTIEIYPAGIISTQAVNGFCRGESGGGR